MEAKTSSKSKKRPGSKVPVSRNSAGRANAGHVHIPSEYAAAITKLAQCISELEAKWQPNPFQVDLIAALLADRKRVVAAETARQVGKTEGIVAAAGLWSQLVPGSQSYYLAPFLNQARKILWDSGRIEQILPGNWIDGFKEKNSTIYFAGSKFCFLTIDGADKFDATRGWSVRDGVLYLDECRDMKDGTWDVIQPALAVHKCPTVLTSSPPDDLFPYPNDPKRPHWFCEAVDDAARHDDCVALHCKSTDNPHFPKEEYDRQREKYYAKGRGYIFEREYNGQRVEGKATREWPMLANVSEYVFSHADLLEEIVKDKSKFRWFCMTDPAGASVWAWLFCGMNPYTKTIYVMDEIYEKDKSRMSTGVMWPCAERKMLDVYPDIGAWRKHYDEAETWFQNEAYQNYGVTFSPSFKQSRSKEENFRLMSDIFLRHKVKFSDRCEHAYWELKNYEDRDSEDHQVDNFRYFLNVSNYSLSEVEEDNRVISLAEERYRKMTGMDRGRNVTRVEDWSGVLSCY